VVITVWTVLVAFFEFFSVFAESLFALLTGEGLVFLVGMARRGVLIKEERGKIPFLISGAAGGSRFLGGIQRNRTIFGLEICQDLNTLDWLIVEGVQQGDLIETCALRMCLLRLVLEVSAKNGS
jgi:hypothetical protein